MRKSPYALKLSTFATGDTKYPAVVFVKDGVEVDRLIGVNAKMTYENKINEHKV